MPKFLNTKLITQEMSELLKQRDEINRRIKEAEEKQDNKYKVQEIALNYFAIVCPHCFGTGETWSGGRDIISDSPIPEICEGCLGEGYVYARKFERKKDYRDLMQYDSRNGINEYYEWTILEEEEEEEEEDS